ncbi:hypothetical protein GCM10023149_26560 [Mucilaginibacter gynuensis]|uniref:Peptidyl-prolyl cis-trans isomerase n=1 Tax=Mucilaginibacter gynuensis TaxID=1302236 RepID=A0ABP8GIB2_9SPHI
MNRLLLIITLLFAVSLTACKKTLIGVERARAQAVIDDGIIQKYIEDNNLADSAKRVGDTIGVWYIIRKPGVGSDIFTNSTLVTVGQTTRLLTTGEVVAQTTDFHPSYILGGNIIKAWQLGIPFIQQGGEIRIIAASRYAYGPYAHPEANLPADAILDFDITLYDVTNN